jgi:hypothetical protein
MAIIQKKQYLDTTSEFPPLMSPSKRYRVDTLIKPKESKESTIDFLDDRTIITIELWNPAKLKEISKLAFKHLEIGAANYGPTLPPESFDLDPKLYTHSPSDPLGRKIHRVLFASIDHIINSHQERKEFTFYLNDISEDGLAKAAKNLATYLNENYGDQGLIIRIEKMVANIFEIESLPEVDSAAFLHPNDCIITRVFPVTHWAFEPPLTPIVDSEPSSPKTLRRRLLHKIVKISRTGLLIRECNPADLLVTKNLQLAISSRNLRLDDLEFQPEDLPHIPNYCFPSGDPMASINLSYRVTRSNLP